LLSSSEGAASPAAPTGGAAKQQKQQRSQQTESNILTVQLPASMVRLGSTWTDAVLGLAAEHIVSALNRRQHQRDAQEEEGEGGAVGGALGHFRGVGSSDFGLNGSAYGQPQQGSSGTGEEGQGLPILEFNCMILGAIRVGITGRPVRVCYRLEVVFMLFEAKEQ
jgi:hypothetical protein